MLTISLAAESFQLTDLTSALVTLGVVGVVIAASKRLLFSSRWGGPHDAKVARQLGFFAICCLGAVAIVLSLPLEESLRGQVLSLAGLVFTAVVGLGSTTLFSNAMAGLMLRSMRGYRPGDFIEVEGRLGRVTAPGLFHTEIQTETRDLCTLPNVFLASHPIKVIRASGTMVTADVSLGYDVPHDEVSALLVQAAEQAQLSEAFVRILELGDFSVTYRVSGFLVEVKQLLTARSRLLTAMLDSLHGAGVEIVSPNFMNQRVLDAKHRSIPAREASAEVQEEAGAAEAIIFDKAEQAAELEVIANEEHQLLEEAKALEKEAGSSKEEHADELRARASELRQRAEQLEAERKEKSEAVRSPEQPLS
jgi:small conductance mechanosensitive channel